MSTTTNLDKLKINYLTQEQYEDAVENEEINENELYFTPGHNNDAIVPVELTQAEYDALTTEQKNNGKVYCVSDASGTYLTASEVSYGSSSVQDALDTEVRRTDALVEQIRNIRSVSRGRVEGGTHTFTLDEFATYLIIMQTSSSEGYVAYILSRYSTYSHLHKLYNGSYVNDVTSYADGVLTITLTYPATVSIVKM